MVSRVRLLGLPATKFPISYFHVHLHIFINLVFQQVSTLLHRIIFRMQVLRSFGLDDEEDLKALRRFHERFFSMALRA